ncbi:MAG: sugar phosphate isomerase [Rhodovulum sulfidophilum]|uniref:Sugar phosphate isomerase n=1 Tax=Rhodovulum sulfidophilum TaxID=35806 RepID=A0A2W5N4C9_RHOSU|nr:MAG: sugar phosphate isomerase [Rhodovulum sulfidophilum]
MNSRDREPVGVAHFSAIEAPPAEFVGLAAAAGFSRVGLRLFPAFPGAPVHSLPAGSASAREVAARLGDTGVTLWDIEFVVIDAAFDPASHRRVLGDAAALGARRLSVCGEDADRARLIDNFAALCALAAEFELAVDLENMGWRPVRAFSDARAVVEAAGAPNGGVLVDALHFFRNGGTPEQLRAAPAGMIRHVQLCDVRGPGPETDAARIAEARGGRFAPGAGELPLTGFLAALPPEAAISVEVPIPEGVSAAAHLGRLCEAARAAIRAAGPAGGALT